MIALTCWGIGEMALKTGYKINGKEIILDDYAKYGNTSVTDSCTKTLDGCYNVNGKNIKASYYVEEKGQIAAELPGDNYYKAPSGAQKFALYGTNTVGGWVDGAKSGFLQEYTGKTGTTAESVVVNIGFDGSRLGELQLDSVGSNYYMLADKIMRTYEYSPIETIKVWCMAVASGGGGGEVYTSSTDSSKSKRYGSGGGGGATALLCIHLKPYDRLAISIPPAALPGRDGQDLTISLYKGSWSAAATGTRLLTGGGGKGGEVSTVELKSKTPGGAFNITKDTQLKYSISRTGSSGGAGSENVFLAEGDPASTLQTLTDYESMYKSSTNLGGIGKHPTTGFHQGGGGASAFPEGRGGTPLFTNGTIYPGPGGGGGAVVYGDLTYSGGGAFWILYA